jgi:outer membrane receptor protein involved in Fe transport
VVAQADQEDATGIQEIVVTAQKRAERLQDVPVSVQAVTGESLQNMGVQNFESFEVPGVRVSRGGMADTITVRGIGSGQNLGFEQSAPMYVDGIYYGRARTQRLAFLDIDRIEVLKGPQPTYFGKNATAGALNIATRRPGREFSSEVEASFEPETDERMFGGAVSTPLGDKWAVRLAGRYRDSKGYLTNTVTGRREPAVEDRLGRVWLTGNPSDSLTVSANVYYGTNLDEGRNNQSTICEPNYRRDISNAQQEPCAFDRKKASFSSIPDSARARDPELFRDNGGGPFLNDLETYGGALQLDWTLGGGLTLTSLTGYYRYDNYQFIDTDQGVANVGSATFIEEYDQLSQEFRLLSPDDAKLKWFVGVYADENNNWVKSSSNFVGANLLPFTPPPVPPQTNRTPAFVANNTGSTYFESDESATSWAVFGEITYPFSDRVAVRLGSRYEEVKKDIAFTGCLTPVPYAACAFTNQVPPGSPNSRTDREYQPTLVFEFRPLDDLLLYASAKRGFKSGGFSGTDADAFDPEKVTAYEVGVKSKFFDNRVLLNVTAFDSKYDDLQVSSFDPVTNLFATTNAASAKSRGVELESQFAATDRLRLALNASYLDATYSDFRDAPCWGGQLVLGTGCGPSSRNPAVNVQNLSGVVTPYAPEWSGTFSADYRLEFGGGYVFGLGGDIYATTRFATLTDINPRSFQGGFAKLNLRASVARDDGRWEVALVGRNVTDKLTAAFRNTIPGGFFSIGSFTEPPATYTLQVRARFD